MSTDEIIQELRQNPELLERFRRALARNMSEDATDITNLDDESLLRLLREDDKARELAARQLSAQRRTSEQPPEDSELPLSSSRDDNSAGSREDENWRSLSVDSEGNLRQTGGPFENGDSPDRRLRGDDRVRSSGSEGKNNSRDTRDFPTRPDERSQVPYERRAPRPPVNPPNPDRNRPSTTRRTNPYPDLPSTRDLYRQVSGDPRQLKRFGADLFLKGGGNQNTLPMDLPAGPDYVLGPGDGLNINIWGSVAQRFSLVVDRSGNVTLPEVGSVQVAGHTIAQAQKLLQGALGRQYRDARIDISLTRLRSIRVYVVGDVVAPGAYDISSLSTPLNALYAAGGPGPQGSLRIVRHYRGRELLREVDLYDLILNGIRSDVERMESGDSILVPPVGPQVSIAGMVRRPAIYELRNERGLAEALELAGGVLTSAALRQITVERIEAHQKRTMLSVNLPEKADGNREALERALGDFAVQDGDLVTIAPIPPYTEGAVYLQGHVFRPGKYSYMPNMQISDLIRSYQDLLPEPAQHAEIIRLVPPEYRPMTVDFNLNEVLGGDDPIELRPFDTVRIFGRYEIDPPKAFIFGEVLRPGEYPLSDHMTAADLVRMAGGFKRSAVTTEGDLTSYVVQKGEKIQSQHETVHIASALSGETNADIALKPNDVLTIRRLSGWDEIGAAVSIEGEVLYPGKYGITEGEKLSSLLKRAGGFRSTAYPEGAVLDRLQVRQIAEKSRQQLIQRIEAAQLSPNVSPNTSAGEQATLMQAMSQQQDHVLASLRKEKATGRLVIKISSDVASWENTPYDVELRADDKLTIPQKPSFVLVTGQVYNSAALTYAPGKTAQWYLGQAGGPTELANKKEIYVIRANGSVVGRNSGSWWSGNVLSVNMRPGDSIVVPEKVLGGSRVWKNILDTAQLTSSLAIAARVATSF